MGGWDRRSVGHGGRVAIVALALAASGLDALGRGPAAVRADQCRVRVERKVKNGQQFANPSGTHATVSTRDGSELDTDNPFFSAALGTNGRSCATCHAAEDGMSLSVSSIKERFEESCGLDPLFTGDGRNAPGHDVSTVDARRAASSVLLSKGLIRIKIRPPANAQYELVERGRPPWQQRQHGGRHRRVQAPASGHEPEVPERRDVGYARGPRGAGVRQREPQEPGRRRPSSTMPRAAAPSDDVLQAIVDFQSALFTAQVKHHRAGNTAKGGAAGGPRNLVDTPYAVDENRILPIPPPPASPLGVLTRNVFTLFNSWASPVEDGDEGEDEDGRRHASRQSVARGEQIFNHRPITDRAPDGSPVVETCTACHNAFNAGNMSHSLATGRPFGGVASVRVSDAAFRTPDLPLYTFREKIPPFRTLVTTDPGQALKTGLTRDWNRFKSSNLRGLASRAPYLPQRHGGDDRRHRRSLRQGDEPRRCERKPHLDAALHGGREGRPDRIPGIALVGGRNPSERGAW